VELKKTISFPNLKNSNNLIRQIEVVKARLRVFETSKLLS
jgi:hypothetical protein